MPTCRRRVAALCKFNPQRHSGLLRCLALGLILLAARVPAVAQGDTFRHLRQAMVEEQIKPRGITQPELLAAMEQVPRHLFVPEPLQAHAYSEKALVLRPGGALLHPPYLMALMASLLDLKPGSKVLEIGNGSGYPVAVLSRIAREVYSLEATESTANQVFTRVTALGYRNVAVRAADGYRAWQEKAPFDAILLSEVVPDLLEAAPYLIKPLLEQLRIGGKLVVAVSVGSFQDLMVYTKTAGGFEGRKVVPVRLPTTGVSAGLSSSSPACSNVGLMRTFRIVERGVSDLVDPARIPELDLSVDKAAILSLLREPQLNPIHLFFANSLTELQESLDWRTIRSDQLSSLRHRPKGSVIYIFALATGSAEDLDASAARAKARLSSVVKWMKNELEARLGELRGAWVGSKVISPFTLDDANSLNIKPGDFRNDTQILNSSVHIVVLPCPWIVRDSLSTEDLPATTTERIAPPSPPRIDEIVPSRLIEAHVAFDSDRALLPRHLVGQELYYSARDLRQVVDKAEKRVLAGIGDFTELKALHAYVEDKFAELRKDLNPLPSSAKSAFPNACCKTALTTFIQAEPMPSSDLVGEKKANSLLDSSQALLSLLVKASHKLTMTVCVISRPDKANFILYPKKDSANRRSGSTNSLITNIYIGRYIYVLSKAGFKSSRSEFDFIDETSSIMECRLTEKHSQDAPLNCRAGAQVMKKSCPE